MATVTSRQASKTAAGAPRSRRPYWRAQVAAHQRSGPSVAAFCRQQGLRKGTLTRACELENCVPRAEGRGGMSQILVEGVQGVTSCQPGPARIPHQRSERTVGGAGHPLSSETAGAPGPQLRMWPKFDWPVARPGSRLRAGAPGAVPPTGRNAGSRRRASGGPRRGRGTTGR